MIQGHGGLHVVPVTAKEHSMALHEMKCESISPMRIKGYTSSDGQSIDIPNEISESESQSLLIYKTEHFRHPK